MGYYLRYFVADEAEINLTLLQEVLKEVSAAYEIRLDEVETIGDLTYDGRFCGQIEINFPGEEIFEDDLMEFKALVGPDHDPGAEVVLSILETTQAIIAVEAFWEGDDAENTLAVLDPLWDWLFTHRKGILQADGEGYYDHDGLILTRKSVF